MAIRKHSTLSPKYNQSNVWFRDKMMLWRTMVSDALKRNKREKDKNSRVSTFPAIIMTDK